MGVFDLVVNEYCSAILISNMDISCLMVHDEQIEKQKLKKVCNELKRTRAENGNYSKAIFKVQDKIRFKKSFPNQSPSITPRIKKDTRYTPQPQEGKGIGTYVDKSSCVKCGVKHEVKFLAGMGNFYGCGNSGHMLRDYHMIKTLRKFMTWYRAPHDEPILKTIFLRLN